MLDAFTAGALRAVRRSEARALLRHAAAVEPLDLVVALIDESESQAASLLSKFGLVADSLYERLEQDPTPPEFSVVDSPSPEPALPHASSFISILQDATTLARALDRTRMVSTEDILASLLPHFGDSHFAQAGLNLPELQAYFDSESTRFSTSIPLSNDITPLELADPGEAIEIGRVLDASANRAREGLRVVEDYVRFVLEDPALTRRLKEVRHRFAEAIRGVDPDLLIASRDTRGDVGTHIMTASESTRENPRGVLTANFKRTAEALRTLEEYSKLIDSWVAGRFEVLRYDVYTLEKLTMTAAASKRSIGDAKLMVLVGGMATLGDLTWVVSEALAGGADVIQLREKNVDDREWLRRAREVRILTAQAKARFIVNDRPDLARLAGADGVHLGQEDISVRDARRIVHPSCMIGVSTHEPVQVEKGILDAASYLGVGPVFASETKNFDDYAGVALVRQAAEITSLPWFAIGGINIGNIDELLAVGARRVAVSAAVVRADYPREAAAALRSRLESV